MSGNNSNNHNVYDLDVMGLRHLCPIYPARSEPSITFPLPSLPGVSWRESTRCNQNWPLAPMSWGMWGPIMTEPLLRWLMLPGKSMSCGLNWVRNVDILRPCRRTWTAWRRSSRNTGSGISPDDLGADFFLFSFSLCKIGPRSPPYITHHFNRWTTFTFSR